VPDEASNRLITQSHGLARLSTKLENPEDLSPKADIELQSSKAQRLNDHEGSATYGIKQ